MLRFSVGAFLLLSCNVFAQEAQNASYEVLLSKAKQADPKLDFKALRLAYSQTSKYNPYQPPRELHAAVINALREKKYDQCLTAADKVLQQNYVDINVHYAAHRACLALNNQEKARFHHYMFDGLIRSILSSGDGKSAASAYVVISNEEEYAVLDATGLRRDSQEVLKEEGRTCHLIVAHDDKNKVYRVFFNIDRQQNWLRNSWLKDEK